MPLLLLIRHGENEYVKTGKLAGRLPGVRLNEKGQKQAQALADALRDVPITAMYSSPLERAMETAAPIAMARNLKITQDPDLMDTDVGKWQGKSLALLQTQKGMEDRANCPVTLSISRGRIISRPAIAHRQCTRGYCQEAQQIQGHCCGRLSCEPIKLAVSHFLGLPLDHFQKLGCDTGSVSVLYVGEMGANVMKLNQRPPFDFLPHAKKHT